jgi:hypothetical protein
MPSDATWRFPWKQLDQAKLDGEVASAANALGYRQLESDERSSSVLEYALEIPVKGPRGQSQVAGLLSFYAGVDDDGAWLSVEEDQADNQACWAEVCAVAAQVAASLGGVAD